MKNQWSKQSIDEIINEWIEQLEKPYKNNYNGLYYHQDDLDWISDAMQASDDITTWNNWLLNQIENPKCPFVRDITELMNIE